MTAEHDDDSLSPGGADGAAPLAPAVRRQGLRWPRWLRFGLLGLLILLAALLGVIVLGISGDYGRRAILNAVLDAVETPGELEIVVGGTSGTWPWRIGLSDVTVADGEGVYARVGRLEVEIAPLALLSRRVEIRGIALEDAALLRIPESSAPPEPKEPKPLALPEIPKLPVDIVVDAVRVRGAALGEAILGRPVRFDLDGAAALAGSGALLDLDVRQTDQAGLTLKFKAERNTARDRLRIHLRARDVDGGLISHLAGDPALGPVRIGFTGSGYGSDWSGSGQVRAGRFGGLGLSLEGGWTDGKTLDLQAVAAPGRAIEGEVRDILGKEVILGAGIDPFHSLSGGPGLGIDNFYVGLAGLALTGRFDVAFSADAPGGGVLDGTIALALGDLIKLAGPETPVRAEAGLVNLSVSGPVANPGVEIVLSADAPGVGAAQAERLDFTLSLLPEDDLYRLAGSGGLFGLEPGVPSAEWPLGDTVTIALGGTLDPANAEARLDSAHAVLDGAILTIDGSGRWAGEDAPRGSGTVRLNVGALNRFAPDVVASADWVSQAAIRLRGDRLTVDLDSAVEGLKPSDPALGALLGNRVALAAGATVDLATTAATLSSLTLTTASGHVDVKANGALEPSGTLRARSDVRLARLAAFGERIDQPIFGALTAGIDFTGSLEAPAIAAKLTSGKLGIRDLTLSDLTLATEARLGAAPAAPDAAWSASLDLAVKSDTGDQQADHTLRLALLQADPVAKPVQNPQKASITKGPSFEGGSTRPRQPTAPPGPLAGLRLLEASGTLAGLTVSPAGTGTGLTITTQTLGDLGALLRAALGPKTPAPAGGSLTVVTALDPVLSVDVEAGALAVAMADGPPLTLRALTLHADQKPAEGDRAPMLTANLAAGFLERAPLRLETVKAEVSGPTDDLKIDLSVSEPGSAGLRLDVVAALQSDAAAGEGAVIVLTKLDAVRAALSAKLARPLRLALKEDDLTVPEAVFTIADGSRDGSVSLSASQAAGRITAALGLEQVPASVIALAPGVEALEGEVNGTLNFDSSAKSGSARLRLSATGLRTLGKGEADDNPSADLSWAADWNGRALTTDLRLDAGPEQTATLTAALPLGRTPDGLPALAPGATIDGRLEAIGRLERIMPLVPTDDHKLAGLARADLVLTGPVDAPGVTGRLGLTDGAYENLSTGTVLQAMTFDFDLTSGALSFTANDPDAGRLSSKGTLRVGAKGVGADLGITLSRLRLAATDDLLAVASGDLKVTGGLADGFDVAGSITLDDVDVTIPDTVPPNVVDLETIEVHGEVPLTPPEKTGDRPEGPVPVRLSIEIVAKDTITIVGKGLDSRWGGTLALRTASDGSIRLSGINRLRRGKLELLGRNFDLQEGLISFDGGVEVDPRLNIIAVNEGDAVMAIITITGPASKPQIDLSSNPSMPQDAILAQVLFGKSPSELTAFEVLQLAEAVSSLAGGGGGGIDPIGAAKSVLGIDVLKFGMEDGTEGERGVSVTVGKYVTDDIYVGVKQGTLPGSSAVTVEMEITRNLLIHTDVSQSSESVIGLRWRWDY